ncbi:MAG: DNA circularization N-terminal domain-containing protein [Candidatus Accumulibacter sp.]|jgi:hypothetical protein|nr:DNA circularization N-terminal domain-containing protein [Accumulibacter sp.]
MGWRDELQPASFRGAVFFARGAELSTGRRLARHEYPQRDLPWLEDMGRKAREYKIEAFIAGPDYMRARDALLKAVEAPGPGQLAHPWLGVVSVTVSECSLSESTASGGLARFSITFVEAGKQGEPDKSADTLSAIVTAKTRALEAFAADFARQFNVMKQPEFVRADAIEALFSVLSAAGLTLPVDSAMKLIEKPLKLAEEMIAALDPREADGAPPLIVSNSTMSASAEAMLTYDPPITMPRYITPSRSQMAALCAPFEQKIVDQIAAIVAESEDFDAALEGIAALKRDKTNFEAWAKIIAQGTTAAHLAGIDAAMKRKR